MLATDSFCGCLFQHNAQCNIRALAYWRLTVSVVASLNTQDNDIINIVVISIIIMSLLLFKIDSIVCFVFREATTEAVDH